MNQQFITIILLLFGNYYYGKADVQELLTDSKTHLPSSSDKFNTGYLTPAAKGQLYLNAGIREPEKLIKTTTHNYILNKPKIIEDPLPVQADSVKPLDIDFKSDKYDTIVKGVGLTALLYQIYQKPLFSSPSSHVPTEQTENQEHNSSAIFFSSDHNVKAESSLQSKTYVKTPVDVDIVPINLFMAPAANSELLNDNNDNELSRAVPVVIFKPGDDISFLKDTSVIDDYEHNFAEEAKRYPSKSNNFKAPTKTTTTPFVRKNFSKYSKTGYEAAAEAAAASSNLRPKISADSESSAATQHLVIHQEENENDRFGHGYIYDKPKIPFTS